MARIKGFAIRGLLKQVKQSGHPGGIAAVLATMPPQLSAHFAKPIGSSGWYPYEAFAALLNAADKTIGKGDLSYMPILGRSAGREDFGSIFKVIAALTSLETILKRGPVFWGQYCDTGSFETTDIVTGAGTAMLKNFPAVERAHCELIIGWIRGIGESAGAKNIDASQVKCVHKGDPWCEYRARWSK